MTAEAKEKKIESYIIFKMMEESFGINVDKVLSILEMQKITQVPKAPPYMKGIMNLRGEVIPVIDSYIKIGVEKPLTITRSTCILVLEIQNGIDRITKLGLLVDHVEEVAEIITEQLLPPPSLGKSFQSEYITGMFQRTENEFTMILNIDKLLDINEIISLTETTTIEEEIINA